MLFCRKAEIKEVFQLEMCSNYFQEAGSKFLNLKYYIIEG